MQKTRNVSIHHHDLSQRVRGICAGVVNARQDQQIAGKCSTRIHFVVLVAFFTVHFYLHNIASHSR